MKRRVALYFVPFFLCGFLFVADIVTAQTIAYRPVWNSFSHDNRQSHGSVARKAWNHADDRTILVLGLDRRPSPVLALSEVSNRDSRRGVLADVLVEVKSDS